MEELLLMNPSSGHGRGNRSFQIVFPKKIKKLRANEGSVEKYASQKLPVIGISTKQMVGGIAGAGATVAVPKILKLDGWKDVAVSGVIAVAGGAAARSMDKDAGEAFLYTGLGITGLKAVRELIKLTKGKTGKKVKKGRRSVSGIEDLGVELGVDYDLLGDNDLLGDDLLGDNDLLGLEGLIPDLDGLERTNTLRSF